MNVGRTLEGGGHMLLELTNVADSKGLYKELVAICNQVNVTDLGGVVYVYGEDVNLYAVQVCKKWGDINEPTSSTVLPKDVE